MRPGDLRALSIRRPLLRGFTKADLSLKTKTPRTGNIGPGLTGGLVPSASEPAPSQRSSDLPPGSATSPEHRIHHNPTSPVRRSKADISIWQRRGHFYLALTYCRRRFVVNM